MVDNQPMLERMARAIGDADYTLGDYDFGWENNPEHWREAHRRTARSALEAIREPERRPEDDVVYAGAGAVTDELGHSDYGSNYDAAKGCFTAMIDAILAEATTPA